jgi:hypothetical protein
LSALKREHGGGRENSSVEAEEEKGRKKQVRFREKVFLVRSGEESMFSVMINPSPPLKVKMFLS